MASSGWVVGAEENTLGRDLRVEPGSGATPGKGFMACSGVHWCGVGPLEMDSDLLLLACGTFLHRKYLRDTPNASSEVGTGRCKGDFSFYQGGKNPPWQVQTKTLVQTPCAKRGAKRPFADTERPLSAIRPLATVLFIKVQCKWTCKCVLVTSSWTSSLISFDK